MLDEENHAKRMEIILLKKPDYIVNMMCYISGYMGDDPKFQEAFKDALENTIYFK